MLFQSLLSQKENRRICDWRWAGTVQAGQNTWVGTEEHLELIFAVIGNQKWDSGKPSKDLSMLPGLILFET